MPYLSNETLPRPVRDHLPPRAQDMFRKAFNNAFVAHGGDEGIAFRIAWATVKRRYEKVGDEWLPRPVE